MQFALQDPFALSWQIRFLEMKKIMGIFGGGREGWRVWAAAQDTDLIDTAFLCESPLDFLYVPEGSCCV